MNTRCRIAAVAALSFAIAGFAPTVAAAEGFVVLAQAPGPDAPLPTPAIPAAPAPATPTAPAPATPAEANKPESSGGVGWYIGTGIGGGFDAKYKVNGRTITFGDALQNTNDKTPIIALNLINVGVTLGPNLMVGFSGSAAAQSGTNAAGNDLRRQINNYFVAVTYFPFEKGLFVRGGGGVSNILIDNGTSSNKSNGYGVLLGTGYALQIGQHHNITFTVDYSRQSYSGSSTTPDSSQFGAAYLGYMYRR